MPWRRNERTCRFEEVDTVHTQELHKVVEACRVTHTVLDDIGQTFHLFICKDGGLHRSHFRLHIKAVGCYRVDLTVVGDHSERLCQSPFRQCIGRETLVEKAERDFEIFICKILVKLFDMCRHDQSLVGDHFG